MNDRYNEIKAMVAELDERYDDFRRWTDILKDSAENGRIEDLPDAYLKESEELKNLALTIRNSLEDGETLNDFRPEFEETSIDGKEYVVCKRGNIVGPDALKRLFASLNVSCYERVDEESGDILVYVVLPANPRVSVAFIFTPDRKLKTVVSPNAFSVEGRSISSRIAKVKGLSGYTYALMLKTNDNVNGFVYVSDRNEVRARAKKG